MGVAGSAATPQGSKIIGQTCQSYASESLLSIYCCDSYSTVASLPISVCQGRWSDFQHCILLVTFFTADVDDRNGYALLV